MLCLALMGWGVMYRFTTLPLPLDDHLRRLAVLAATYHDHRESGMVLLRW